MTKSASEWLLVQPARAAPRFKLFCFPYAGGSATIFHHWSSELPDAVEVGAIRLPGRATRMRDRMPTSMPALVDALLEGLAPELERPYGLFGHSMGARIAFELARAIVRRGLPTPAQLWTSGAGAPHLAARRPPIHDLPEHELIAELRRYDGAPAEVFDNRELMELFVPILRADFALHDTYTFTPATPLAMPLTAFGGIADPYVLAEDLAAWSEHTTGPFVQHVFPGGHFFLNTHRRELLARLAADLAAWT